MFATESMKGILKRAYYSGAIGIMSELERSTLLQDEQIIQRVCDDLGIYLFNPVHHAIFPAPLAVITPEDVYSQSRKEIEESDIVILNCRYPSHWAGQAVEIAAIFNIPVVLLIPYGMQVSRTIRGAPALKYEVRFASREELHADLAGALSLAFKTAELQQETLETNLSGIVEAISTINTELISYLKLNPEGLYVIDPRQFEELVAEMLAGFGWEVELTPKSKDGGYDIFAVAKNTAPGVNAAWIVECKRYAREKKVGVEIVRALYGSKSSFNGINAMLATTSSFTRGAREFKTSRYNLELRDYAGVVEWLKAYRPNPNGTLYIQSQK